MVLSHADVLDTPFLRLAAAPDAAQGDAAERHRWGALRPWRAGTEEIIDEAFRSILPTGRGGLVADVARPVPVLTICLVLGIDSAGAGSDRTFAVPDRCDIDRPGGGSALSVGMCHRDLIPAAPAPFVGTRPGTRGGIASVRWRACPTGSPCGSRAALPAVRRDRDRGVAGRSSVSMPGTFRVDLSLHGRSA